MMKKLMIGVALGGLTPGGIKPLGGMPSTKH